MNYGNIYLGDFQEYVVNELKERRCYAATRAGTIRALLSEEMRPGDEVQARDLDSLVVSLSKEQGSFIVDFVQAHVGEWVRSHADALEAMGIDREDARSKGLVLVDHLRPL